MRFSDQQVEELRDRADLAAIIGRRIQLRKTGSSFMGLCPFHGESTPSFSVVPTKQFWHCFGCGESGDVFKFYMKLDGLSFVDALKQVASDAGFALEEERIDPAEAARRKQMEEQAALLERAVKFYQSKLKQRSGLAAQQHLRDRGIGEKSIEQFRLGFAGTGMDDLARALDKAGVPQKLAIDSGLCIAGRGSAFDRFHGRLIIPIRVPRPPDGRTVALGGRVMDGAQPMRNGKAPAKYINSPETALYSKSHVLFGLDQARDAIRREERAVIVEGYFDVIGVHQAGLPLAVATCGTALTTHHLELLSRIGAKDIVFLFDGDAAGVRGATKAAEMCAKALVPARVATLPPGEDPDDYARKNGVEGLTALLNRARPAVQVLIDRALESAGPNPTVEDRVRAVGEVRSVVLAAPDALSRELYVAQIAERLHVKDDIIRDVIESPQASPGRPQNRKQLSSGTVAPAAQTTRDAGPMRGQIDARRAAQARKKSELERNIVATLNRYPRIVSRFIAEKEILRPPMNPLLQAAAEKILHSLPEDPDGLPNDQLYADEILRRQMEAAAVVVQEMTAEQALDHIQKEVNELELIYANIERDETASPVGDDEAQRAQLMKAQEGLNRRRELHKAKRELGRR